MRSILIINQHAGYSSDVAKECLDVARLYLKWKNYENKLTRQIIVEIISRCLVLNFMCDGDVSYCNCEFSLEDYEEKMAEREIKENKK